jgi:hypothetical protein
VPCHGQPSFEQAEQLSTCGVDTALVRLIICGSLHYCRPKSWAVQILMDTFEITRAVSLLILLCPCKQQSADNLVQIKSADSRGTATCHSSTGRISQLSWKGSMYLKNNVPKFWLRIYTVKKSTSKIPGSNLGQPEILILSFLKSYYFLYKPHISTIVKTA